MDPYTNSSTVEIIVSQTHSWTLSRFPCNQALIDSLGSYLDGGFFYGEPNIVCQPNATACGGTGWTTIMQPTFCTDFSIAVQISSGSLISRRTLSRSSNIRAGFASNSWAVEILTTAGAAANYWNVMTRIDLTQKYPINSSPGSFSGYTTFLILESIYLVTGSLPIIRVIEGQTAIIQIPRGDWDASDDIRCRWASSSAPGGNECGDICSNLPGATLSSRSVIDHICF